MLKCSEKSILDFNDFRDQMASESDQIFGIFEKYANKEFIKTASSGDEDVQTESDNIKCSVVAGDILEENDRFASKKDDDYDEDLDIFEDRVTFVSKEVKDPHYEVYVAQAKIKKDGKWIWLVTYYMRELYLGRYLIKRNVYFLEKNKSEAKSLFKDLVKATKQIRVEYYSDEIISSKIPQLTQNLINSVTGDFVFGNEDKLGTTVSRKHLNESAVYEWFHRNNFQREDRRLGYEDE